MFTGIVQAVGRVAAMEDAGEDRRLTLEPGGLDLGRLAPGDSVAVSGVCLTAVAVTADTLAVDVSAETLRCTTLGRLTGGAGVNLEPAVTPATALGGHLVMGHVDGVGEVVARTPEGRSERWRLRVPAELARYVAPKGCITVDGVSLTVNEVGGEHFEVNLIPHTLAVTTLGDLQPGAAVNVEVDIVARYLERLLAAGAAAGAEPAPGPAGRRAWPRPPGGG